MNLFLSLQAAYTAPMLMMSQNRLAARDRLEAHNDYEINRTAEEEVRAVRVTRPSPCHVRHPVVRHASRPRGDRGGSV
jgi:hypothetical protein